MFEDKKKKKKELQGGKKSGNRQGFGGVTADDVNALLTSQGLNGAAAQIAALTAAAAAEEANDQVEEGQTDTEQAAQDAAIAANAAAVAANTAADAVEESEDDAENATQDAAIAAAAGAAAAAATQAATNAGNIAALDTALQNEIAATDAEQAAQDARLAALEAIPADDDTALEARVTAVEALLPDDDSALLASTQANAASIVANAAALAAEIADTDADIATLVGDVATNAANLAAEIAATDAEQIIQDDRLTNLEETRKIVTDASISVFVAVPGAANEVAGDYNDIPSALEELDKYTFVGASRGIVNIRAGEHQVTTSIGVNHDQPERIRIIGVNPGANTAVTYSGDVVADEAQFDARFQAILVCAGTNNKVFNHTTTAGNCEIYYLGFKNESSTNSTYGIYNVSFKERLTLVRCGFFGFRYGIYCADEGDTYLLGVDILHCGLYALYAVRARINPAQGSNGKLLVDTCTYFAYANGIGARIYLFGSAARKNELYRARSYAMRAIYGGEIYATQTEIDGCGTCLQITHNAFIYATTTSVINNTSRLASVDAGSRAFITAMTGPATGTNTQQTIRATDGSYIKTAASNTNVIYSPLLDVEGNFNSIIT